jgi:hypothetical protein
MTPCYRGGLKLMRRTVEVWASQIYARHRIYKRYSDTTLMAVHAEGQTRPRLYRKIYWSPMGVWTHDNMRDVQRVGSRTRVVSRSTARPTKKTASRVLVNRNKER